MMFREMRLKKQEMEESEMIFLLESATNGVLAVSGDDGYPYAVPLSYGYLDGKIYFHSTSGNSHKMDAIRRNPKVSFCIVTKDAILPAEFNTLYQSVIAFGQARILTEPSDIEKGIMTITKKYSGEYLEQGKAYAQKRTGDFLVVEIAVTHMTGKYGT